MSPRQRSPHSKHGHGPTIGRRALPALALTGASGILLLALDHPAGSDASSTSSATTPGTTAVLSNATARGFTSEMRPSASTATTPLATSRARSW